MNQNNSAQCLHEWRSLFFSRYHASLEVWVCVNRNEEICACVEMWKNEITHLLSFLLFTSLFTCIIMYFPRIDLLPSPVLRSGVRSKQNVSLYKCIRLYILFQKNPSIFFIRSMLVHDTIDKHGANEKNTWIFLEQYV
jgi:hypothetical protein